MVGLYVYLDNSIEQYYTSDRLAEITRIVQDEPVLPELHFEIYEKYGGSKIKRFLPLVFSSLYNELFNRYRDYRCLGLELARLMPPDTMGKRHWHIVVLSLYLEKTLTKREMLNYLNTYQYYGLTCRTIHEASMKYFGTSVHSLTEKEMLGLLIISDSPIRYSPIRNPENYNRALERASTSIGLD